MQLPGGAIGWALRPDGTPDDTALLTGNASLFQALRCGIALAGLRGESQPDWELAVTDLGTALRSAPEAFADRSRYSMDWYYPVLGGAVTGAGGPRPAGRRLGPVRRPRPGRPLRRRPAVGDRRRDLRAGPRPRRRRADRRGDRAGRGDAAPPATTTAPTGPASSSPTTPAGRSSGRRGRRPRWCWPPTRSPARRRRRGLFTDPGRAAARRAPDDAGRACRRWLLEVRAPSIRDRAPTRPDVDRGRRQPEPAGRAAGTLPATRRRSSWSTTPPPTARPARSGRAPRGHGGRARAQLGAHARTLGVARAGTPFVAFADDDSWWAPGDLARAVEIMRAHPRLAVLNARILVGAEERLDPVCRRWPRARWARARPARPLAARVRRLRGLVRTAAFEAVGGFDPVVRFPGEEERLALDLAAAGWGLAYVDAVDRAPPPVPAPAPARAAAGGDLAQPPAHRAMRLPWTDVAQLLPAPPGGGRAGAGLLRALPDVPAALRRRRPIPAAVRADAAPRPTGARPRRSPTRPASAGGAAPPGPSRSASSCTPRRDGGACSAVRLGVLPERRTWVVVAGLGAAGRSRRRPRSVGEAAGPANRRHVGRRIGARRRALAFSARRRLPDRIARTVAGPRRATRGRTASHPAPRRRGPAGSVAGARRRRTGSEVGPALGFRARGRWACAGTTGGGGLRPLLAGTCRRPPPLPLLPTLPHTPPPPLPRPSAVHSCGPCPGIRLARPRPPPPPPSAGAVDAGAGRRPGGQPLGRDRPAAGLADAVVAGSRRASAASTSASRCRACSSSATTCCRSKAIVAPSGSCSSSALDDCEAATTLSNSRVSASIWAARRPARPAAGRVTAASAAAAASRCRAAPRSRRTPSTRV